MQSTVNTLVQLRTLYVFVQSSNIATRPNKPFFFLFTKTTACICPLTITQNQLECNRFPISGIFQRKQFEAICSLLHEGWRHLVGREEFNEKKRLSWRSRKKFQIRGKETLWVSPLHHSRAFPWVIQGSSQLVDC